MLPHNLLPLASFVQPSRNHTVTVTCMRTEMDMVDIKPGKAHGLEGKRKITDEHLLGAWPLPNEPHVVT